MRAVANILDLGPTKSICNPDYIMLATYSTTVLQVDSVFTAALVVQQGQGSKLAEKLHYRYVP